MSEIQEHAAYLSDTIGPRPAGTEEEQQAALYIAEEIQKDTGLTADVEEFKCNPNYELPKVVCGFLTLLLVVLALFLPVMAVPSMVLTLLVAALVVSDALGYSLFARLPRNGVSQNVVAKYTPTAAVPGQISRQRKIVVVANYDSGKVQKELGGPLFGILPQIRWAEMGAFVLVPVLLLIRFVSHASGVALIVFNVLLVIAALVAMLPAVAWIVHRSAKYNDAANCNASGVAVLMEIAARIGRGRVEMGEGAGEEVVMHGEQAAYEAGLVPQGVGFSYDAGAAPIKEPDFPAESPEARLLAAKAAIAALTGKPVSNTVNVHYPSSPAVQGEAGGVPIVINGVAAKEPAPVSGEAAEEVAELAQASAHAPSAEQNIFEAQAPSQREPEADDGVPAWFKAAQKKAKKAEPATAAQRSRYADALAAAEANAAATASANAAAVAGPSEAEMRLQQMRDSIMQAKAPSFEDVEAEEIPMASQDAVQPAIPAAELEPSEAPAEPARTSEIAPVTEQPAAEPSAFIPSIEPAPAVDAAVSAQQAAAEAVAAADRTISFIPVAIDGDEILQESRSLAAQEVRAGALDVLFGDDPSADAPVSVTKRSDRKKRSIALPSLTGPLSPLDEGVKQNAPLAGLAATADEAAQSKARSQMRSSLPSFSDVIGDGPVPAERQVAAEPASAVSAVGSFSSSGATTMLAPVGDELFGDTALEDMYVDDADDSAYEENYTETGAFAGPGYVEMPKSRASRLFGRFRRNKKKEEESTPQQWLNVDDDFEAREVGKARGSWDSFREDDPYEAQSGAYADNYGDDYFDEEEDDFYYEDGKGGSRTWNGGAFSRESLGRLMNRKKDAEPAADEDAYAEPDVAGEQAYEEAVHVENIERIHDFRHPEVNTEVWFVALGAEHANCGGMEAFLTEHADELRGSIIINLEGMGAGHLSLIEKEGMYRPALASSRMKRFTRKAANTLGLNVGTETMLWKNGSAAFANRRGFQAMHLAGMKDGKPAFYGEIDDVIDNIDEELMLTNADFVMEIIKDI